MELEYTVVRSSRRTVAIHITPEGKTEVRAPHRVPARFLEDFVQAKAGWIQAHAARQRQRLAEQAAFALEEGTLLPILGQELPVLIRPERKTPALAEEGFLLPDGGDEARRKAWVEELYRQTARRELPPRVKAWSARTGLACNGLRITGAKTRWGSCSGRDSLSFSWRLMAAPPRAVDYVVLHELAHTMHHDHSPDFWALVARYEPGWQECRELLRRVQDLAGWL